MVEAFFADVVELAVEEAGAGYGADFDFIADPCSTLAGNLFLRELISKGQFLPLVAENEMPGLLFVLFQAGNGRGFPEKEAKVIRRLQWLFEGCVGMDGEIGRDEGKFAARSDILP